MPVQKLGVGGVREDLPGDVILIAIKPMHAAGNHMSNHPQNACRQTCIDTRQARIDVTFRSVNELSESRFFKCHLVVSKRTDTDGSVRFSQCQSPQ